MIVLRASKSAPDSVDREDYFTMTAGKAIANSTLKTLIKNQAPIEALVQGKIVRVAQVEADTACGGPVGTFGVKV